MLTYFYTLLYKNIIVLLHGGEKGTKFAICAEVIGGIGRTQFGLDRVTFMFVVHIPKGHILFSQIPLNR